MSTKRVGVVGRVSKIINSTKVFRLKCKTCGERKLETEMETLIPSVCKECAEDVKPKIQVIKITPQEAAKLAKQLASSIPLYIESETFRKPAEPSVPIPPSTFSTPGWTKSKV